MEVTNNPSSSDATNKEEQVPQLTQEQMKQYMQNLHVATTQLSLENLRLTAIQTTLEMKKSKLELLTELAEGPDSDENAIEARKQGQDLIKSILAMKI
jgi:hypothetical protein